MRTLRVGVAAAESHKKASVIMHTPTVTNLESPRSGNPVANQFVITTEDGETFQSYQTPIAKKSGYLYTISSDWNYSRTTSKYFYQWLRSFGWNGAEIADLTKWLKKSDRKDGDKVAILGPNSVEVKYVEAL